MITPDNLDRVRSASESLLRDVLANVYHQDDQQMSFGEHTLGRMLPQLSRLDPEMASNRVQSMLSAMSLRPVHPGNTLGRIHDSVMIMCQDDHPEFRAYAVCLAKASGFLGRLYTNSLDGVAVVLSLTMFEALYAINRLYMVADSESDVPTDQRIGSFVQLCQIISHSFGHRTLSPSKYSPHYPNKEELQKTHFVANCQQQFVLLHEFGHLAISSPLATEQEGADCEGRPLEVEFKADEWAATKIRAFSGEFYIPWLQLRSLLWLFEFMHFVEVIELHKLAANSHARQRFDRLRYIIDGSGQILPREVDFQTRSVSDDLTNHWDLVYGNFKDWAPKTYE
jgi:hypothetical protein